jgi:hypothetical protein
MRSKIFTARRCSALFLLLGVGLLAGAGYASRAESSSATDHASAAVPTSGRHRGTAASAPLASIDLDTETVTANSAVASVSPIDYGSDITLTIPSRAAPLGYRLSIPLSSDESLAVLTTGAVAIIQTFPIPAGDYPGLEPPADYQDSLDQDHPDDEADQGDQAPDDGTGDIDDNQDPSWYPDGDAIDSGPRDGMDIADDAFEQASNELPDSNSVMISAFDPPLAIDANGESVRVSFAKTSDGLAVSISPSSSAVFPIEVRLAYGFDPDSYDPPTS